MAASLLNGLRHGFDIDHVAAIGDLVSVQTDRRRSLFLALLYAVGHAGVVMALGLAAVVLGLQLPAPVDAVMGSFVGVTLIALGLYVLYSVARYRSEVRLAGRWTLLAAFIRKRWRPTVVEHAHEHGHDVGHDHVHVEHPVGGSVALATKTHVHTHRHLVTAADPLPARSGGGAALIGALHGIGAETPTQLVLFLTAAGVGSVAMGMTVLAAFVGGMLVSNGVLAVGAAYGLRAGDRMPRTYMAFAVVTALFSVAVGTTYLTGS